jgi:hypothetical protein
MAAVLPELKQTGPKWKKKKNVETQMGTAAIAKF